jgi:zinc protease
MKKFIFLILTSIISCTLSAKSIVNIQQWKTQNGVRVLFVNAPQIPMLDLAVVFKAGSVYDQAHAGLAMLTNAMLNEGAGQYSADQLADQLNNVGALFNNYTSKEMSVFSLRTLVQQNALQSALQTFGVILRHPTFPEKNLRQLKQQMLVGLQAAEQQPDYLANRAFAKAVFGKQPYASPTEGSLKSVPQLTRTEVQTFYNQYYIAQNAMLVMVGDVTRVQAEVIATEVVGNLPEGVPAAPIKPVTDNAANKISLKFPSSQTAILIGELGIKRSSPDYFPLKVGNYILGGAGNLTSILMSNVREKYGLTYGVYSNFSPLTERGAFAINLKSRNDQAARASNMVQGYLADYMAEGPTQLQLKAAKDFLLGSFPLSISNNAQILSTVAELGYYHLPLNYLDTYQKKINAVTTSDVKKAFNHALDLKRLVIVSVGGKANEQSQ